MLFLIRRRKKHRKAASFAGAALKLNFSLMKPGSVFYDGKAQARAADLLGMTFIHSVKALKDSILVLG